MKFMVKKFYVTTAIDYVNAKPHIGHAFEKVLADALIRWKKLKGNETWFLTGTDENAQKNVQAAKEAKTPTKKFVAQNAKKFVDLCKKLDVEFDRFIRTTEKEHVKKSQEIFKEVYDKGEIYKGKYEGYYCTGCEGFKTDRDLVEGKCIEHDKEPEWMSEEAYFFKLSKYKDRLLKFAETYIVPNSKKNEIVSRLKIEGLKDLCVSRTNLDWGIDSPIDKKFKIYVWFDALINYISGAEENWPADVHIVGKGINWFHSVIWPAMLISAGYDLPHKLLVHGYLNVGGKKMSKTLGNVIDPVELVRKYGSDSVRYSLLRCSVFEDSDYSEEILIERHNNELADKLGNLVSRVSTLAEKYGLDDNVDIHTKNVEEDVSDFMDRFEFDKALSLILGFVDTLNQFVQEKKPWETHDKKDLFELVTGIRLVTILLWPFIPRTCEKIAKIFGFKISLEELNHPLKIVKIKKSAILFKKIK